MTCGSSASDSFRRTVFVIGPGPPTVTGAARGGAGGAADGAAVPGAGGAVRVAPGSPAGLPPDRRWGAGRSAAGEVRGRVSTEAGAATAAGAAARRRSQLAWTSASTAAVSA